MKPGEASYDLIIYGKWLAWLLVADNLKDNCKIAIIHNWKITNSQVSGGEICTRWLKQDSLKDTILEAGEFLNDRKMLDIFLSNIEN